MPTDTSSPYAPEPSSKFERDFCMSKKPKRPKRHDFGKYVKSHSRWWKNKEAFEKACIPPKEGHIYVFALGYDNLYKIGMTTDVKRRLTDLQAANPKLACVFSSMVRDMRKAEKSIHKCLRQNRVERELFTLKNFDISKFERLVAPFKFQEYSPQEESLVS